MGRKLGAVDSDLGPGSVGLFGQPVSRREHAGHIAAAAHRYQAHASGITAQEIDIAIFVQPPVLVHLRIDDICDAHQGRTLA